MASALQNRRYGRHNPRKATMGPMTRSQAKKAQKKVKKEERAAAQKAKRAERIALAKAKKAESRAKQAEKRAKRAEARKASAISKRARRKESTIAKRAKAKARRASSSARRKAVSAAVRKADAECRKLVQVKVMCPPKKRAAVMKAARAAAKGRSAGSEGAQMALLNRGRRRARHNVSALQNRRARHNGLMRMRHNGSPMAMARSYAMQTLPWVIGAAGGFAAHAAVEQMGVTKQIEQLALKIPTAGRYIAAGSHTIQGAAAAAILGMVAKAVGGKAAPYIKDTAISAIVIGVAYDAQRLMQAKKDNNGKWALPTDLGDLAFGDLAFGDLAFGDLGFNVAGSRRSSDLVPMAGVSALGDGLAYETAPLTADYSQASLGDAAHCGADFSAAEGQAMINGRGHYLHRYGAPPHRMQHNPKGAASHLAGREGHRWGWLVKMVGWEKAQQIASLPPESRIKVLHKLRAAALSAFEKEMLNYEAAQIAREIPEQLTDLVPTAGGAMGAQGAGELGDSALFMGA